MGGSLRPGSRSRVILDAALRSAATLDAQTSSWTVDEEPLPFYRPGETPDPATERFLKQVRDADAFIWSSPAYHGTLSAPVKNLIDHMDALRDDRPPFLAGKVVGVLSIGEGTLAAVQAVGALTEAAHALRAFVVPLSVPVCDAARAVQDGKVADTAVAARLANLGALVVAMALRLRASSY
jgi:FMN reductase